MFIPAINTGIEYQGKQHYEAVDYFGGDEKLAENAIRDKTKSDLCKQNHVILHYWPYTKKVTFSAVREYLGKKPSDVNVQLSQFTPVPVTNVLLKADTHTKKEKRERQKEKTEKHLQTVIRAYDKNGIFVGEYTTLAAASEEVGVSMASVQKCLSGQRKFAGNLMWHREDWGTDPLGINDLFGALEEGIDGAKSTDDTATSQKTPGVRKSVIQIDPATGEIVSVFESISAAARAVGISSKGIQDVLKKKQKTAGGFYWQSDDIAE